MSIEKDEATAQLASEMCRGLQEEIIASLESQEPEARFELISWERKDDKLTYGGGGTSALLRGGSVFDQAGVNVSAVEGYLPEDMTFRLLEQHREAPFFAAGLSLVVHPRSPHIPTTHANIRYLQVADKSWVGGGIDLTPYLLYEEDATHFHTVLQSTCEAFPDADYRAWKQECDEYFFLPHRGEARGVGGIFFDYLGRDTKGGKDYFPLLKNVGKAFTPAYLPIVERRKEIDFSSEERHFQLLRRGRYVEFNLLYDRGTLFGLKTNGRISSIFMSFPPEVRWDPDEPAPPTERAQRLVDVVKNVRDWV